MAWLDVVPEQSTKSRGDQFSELERKGQIVTSLEMPQVEEGLYLIDLLFEAGPVLPSTMGFTGLSWVELESWLAITSLRLDHWEVGVIKRLSNVYAKGLVDYKSRAAPPPYSGIQEDELEDSRERVHNFFDSLSKKSFGKRKSKKG